VPLTAPARYCEYLTKERYHPRSNKHGDFLAQAFLTDLLEQSPLLKKAAAEGKVAYSLNFAIQVAVVQEGITEETLKDLAWNIDLAFGVPKPAVGGKAPKPKDRMLPGSAIKEADLGDIWMMVDAKGVMTEHGKARRNRQRDLTALWAVMHTFYPKSVVGAVLPINIASTFQSPLNDHETDHGNIEQIVKETLSIFRAVKRKSPTSESGIEGVGCFVVDFANKPGAKAVLRTTPPAPAADDPIRYENFVSSMAGHLEERFASRLA
jgi:hypothetical protein